MPRAVVRTSRKRTNRAVRERRATYKAASPRSEFKRVTRCQINAVVRKIVDEFNPEKVILFGSYAYGKPNIDSDVDMLVIMESDERPAPRTARVIGAVHGKTFPMDLLVRTPAELEQRLKIGDYFFQEILGMGKVLYERRTA
jgi:predicted nucleotidyltransferase